MNIRVIILSVVCAVSLCARSNDWDKDTKKAFKKEDSYNIEFNFGQTTYCGLDSTEFVEYYSTKNQLSPKFLAIALKQFRAYFVTKFNGKSRTKELVYPKHDASLKGNIYIDVITITENAGITADVTLYVDDISKGKTFTLTVKDGRWNTFDILLRENAEELAKKLIFKLWRLNIIEE